MSPATVCTIIALSYAGPGIKHPGSAQMNLDGSWTVDWPMIEDLAAQPVRDTPVTGNITDPLAVLNPPKMPADVKSSTQSLGMALGFYNKFEVLLARALLAAKRAGRLYENPTPDNTCPDQ